MEATRRIRDLSHHGTRWIVSVRANRDPRGVWRGRAVFFRDGSSRDPEVEDALSFEALALEELVAQASALSLDEIGARLARALGEGGE